MIQWRKFVKAFFACLLVLVLIFYSFVLLMDPYDSLPFSLNIERVQVVDQQRLFYPSLARSSKFDSAIIGNSNIRLLRPDILSKSIGGNWVNLAINAASSWEQEQIFNVFLHNHSEVKNVLIGLDYLWCYDQYADQRFVGATQEADFPAWLYDKSQLNNLPPLNLGTIKHSWLLLLTELGMREREFGPDGYTVFMDSDSEYDLDRARIAIYGSDMPKLVEPADPPLKMSPSQRAEIPISALDRLARVLNQLPAGTRTILLFVPYHSYYQARPGSELEIVWDECKRRVVSIAERRDNSYVLDFMIRSNITTKDDNYWDHKHYRVAIGNELSYMIGNIVNGKIAADSYRILHRPRSGYSGSE